MKLHSIILTHLILGSLNIMAADQKQPLTSGHRRYDTGVARTAFTDEQEAMLKLKDDVDLHALFGRENELNDLLKQYKDTSLQWIVAAGIEQCKKNDADLLDSIEKTLGQVEQQIGHIRYFQSVKLRYPTASIPDLQAWCDTELGRIRHIHECERFKGRPLGKRGDDLLAKRLKLKTELENLKSPAPKPSEPLQTKTPPLQLTPQSHARNAGTIRNWVAGGVITGVAIVAAVVYYFKWARPALVSR